MKIDRDQFLATAFAISAVCAGCAKKRPPAPYVAPPYGQTYPQPNVSPPHGAQPCPPPAPGQPISPACEAMPPPGPAYE